MPDAPTPPDDEMNLVMPFVTVCSVGGPHDDESYVAGAEVAQLGVEFQIAAAVNAVPCPRYVRSDNVPQVDLVAMRHGFTAVFTPWDEHPDEWTRVDLTNSRGLTCTEGPDDGA